MEKVLENLLKYSRIVKKLEENNIKFNGLVDGLVQTYHIDNPDYKHNQNPIWWDVASEQDIVEGIIKTFSKPTESSI